MRHAAPLRLARSLAITATVFTLSSGGHLLGGGSLPSPAVALLLALLLMMPVMALAGRRLSFAALLALLGGGQFVLHKVFGAVSHHGMHAGEPPIMALAHLAAAAGTAWLLWKGETALWQMLAWLRPLVLFPAPVPTLPRRPWSLISVGVFVPVRWRMLRVDSPRGPPACLVPAAVAG